MALPFVRRPPLNVKPSGRPEIDWSHPLAEHLRGFWLASEEVGTAVANLAHPLFDGTLGGTVSPTWVNTAYGSGLNFTGGGERVTLGRGALIDNLPNQTFETLIQYGGTTGGSQRIIAKMTSSFYNGLMLTSGGNVEYQRDRATLEHYYLTSLALTSGEFYHLIGTHDSVTGATQVYVNGTPVPASSYDAGSGALVDDSGTDLLLGNRSDNARTFKGVIVFARVWSMFTSLSIAEELFQNPYGLLMPHQPASRVFFFPPSAAAPVDITGIATGIKIGNSVPTISAPNPTIVVTGVATGVKIGNSVPTIDAPNPTIVVTGVATGVDFGNSVPVVDAPNPPIVVTGVGNGVKIGSGVPVVDAPNPSTVINGVATGVKIDSGVPTVIAPINVTITPAPVAFIERHSVPNVGAPVNINGVATGVRIGNGVPTISAPNPPITVTGALCGIVVGARAAVIGAPAVATITGIPTRVKFGNGVPTIVTVSNVITLDAPVRIGFFGLSTGMGGENLPVTIVTGPSRIIIGSLAPTISAPTPPTTITPPPASIRQASLPRATLTNIGSPVTINAPAPQIRIGNGVPTVDAPNPPVEITFTPMMASRSATLFAPLDQSFTMTLAGPPSVRMGNMAPRITTTAYATFPFKYNNFGVNVGDEGAIIYTEGNMRTEWLQVAVHPQADVGKVYRTFQDKGKTVYEYYLLRDLDGSGTNAWDAGTSFVNTGKVGDGFIMQYANYGMTRTGQAATARRGPTMVGHLRVGLQPHEIEERWVVGNLGGYYDYASSPAVFGFAAGDRNGPWIGVDATNGLRIMRSTTNLGQWDISGNIRVGDVTKGHVLIGSTGIMSLKRNTTTVMVFDPVAGTAYFNSIVNISTTGEIRQGTGTVGTNFSGIRIYNSGGVGVIAGYSSTQTAPMWYTDSSTGEIVSGDSRAIMGPTGIRLKGGGASGGFTIASRPINTGSDIKWYRSDLGLIASIYGTADNAYSMGLVLEAYGMSGVKGGASEIRFRTFNSGGVSDDVVISDGRVTASAGAFTYWLNALEITGQDGVMTENGAAFSFKTWNGGSYGGGGWYMTDGTWVRSLNGKWIYTTGIVRADGGFQRNGTQVLSYVPMGETTLTDTSGFVLNAANGRVVGAYTIDMAGYYGIPSTAKAVQVRFGVKWDTAADGYYATLEAPTGLYAVLRANLINYFMDTVTIVPLDSNGRLTYKITGYPVNKIYMNVLGYFV